MSARSCQQTIIKYTTYTEKQNGYKGPALPLSRIDYIFKLFFWCGILLTQISSTYGAILSEILALVMIQTYLLFESQY
jgi:hypothetical protein